MRNKVTSVYKHRDQLIKNNLFLQISILLEKPFTLLFQFKSPL